jgi:hypothetical protein
MLIELRITSPPVSNYIRSRCRNQIMSQTSFLDLESHDELHGRMKSYHQCLSSPSVDSRGKNVTILFRKLSSGRKCGEFGSYLCLLSPSKPQIFFFPARLEGFAPYLKIVQYRAFPFLRLHLHYFDESFFSPIQKSSCWGHGRVKVRVV